MKRVGIMLVVLGLVVVVLCVVARQPAEAQRGGAQAQVFRQIRVLDTYWTLLAFEVKVEDEVLAKARPALQKAYDKRKQVLEAAAGGDREAMNKLANFQEEIDNDLKKALGDETFQALQKAYEEQPRMGGRPAGGGGAAGGGRGGAAG